MNNYLYFFFFFIRLGIVPLVLLALTITLILVFFPRATEFPSTVKEAEVSFIVRENCTHVPRRIKSCSCSKLKHLWYEHIQE